jgi:hypothetical protein
MSTQTDPIREVEQRIKTARLRILESEGRLARQQGVVTSLAGRGQVLEDAERLLAEMQSALDTLNLYLERLEKGSTQAGRAS